MNRLLISLALFTLIAGCSSGVSKPYEGRNDPYPAGQIHFSSAELQDMTAVGRPIASRDAEGGILYITVPIRSTVNDPLTIDYRVTFMDRNGQPLGTSGWFTRSLTPNTPETITVNSLGPRAADFQVDFRPAK